MPPIISYRNNRSKQPQHPQHELHGNRSEKISVWVNTVLLLCTLMALYFTYNANQISKKALEESSKTNKDNFNLANEQFKLAQEQYKSSIESGNKSDSVTNRTLAIAQQNAEAASEQANISKKVMGIQLEALKNSKNTFEIENNPILIITDVKKIIRSNSNFDVIATIKNIGKQVAHIYSTGSGYSYSKNDTTTKVTLESIDPFNLYLMKDSIFSFVLPQTFKTNLTEKEQLIIEEGKLDKFFGLIFYTNVTSNNKKTFTFYIGSDEKGELYLEKSD